jgi:hypothetical protein
MQFENKYVLSNPFQSYILIMKRFTKTIDVVEKWMYCKKCVCFVKTDCFINTKWICFLQISLTKTIDANTDKIIFFKLVVT